MANDYTDDYSATLTANYTAGGTSMSVSSTVGLPASGRSFYLKVDNEYFLCTSYSGGTLTVAGNQGNPASGAANHASTAQITGCWWIAPTIDNIRSDMSQIGTYANLPTAGMKSGDRFRCTDAPYEFIYASSAWNPFIAAAGQVIVPPSTGWSWDNQGSSSVDQTHGFIHFVAPSASATQIVVRYRTAPSTPYTITAAFQTAVDGMATPASSDAFGFGVVFRDSSTGKIIEWRIGVNGSNAAEWTTAKWTTSTSFSAAYTDISSGNPQNFFPHIRYPVWMQIKDDGTNLTWSWSLDGQYFFQFDQRSRTDFISGGPGQVGFSIYNGSGKVVVNLLSWG